ncbi:MAG: segregation/condensation protein A [SAR324 cluster bacterium]|nr:segregation/condensation protein A [SAR324 cluster bacterium]
MEIISQEQDFSVFPNLNNPLEIKIPIFEGPLDLLLHLIRKKELNIYKVQLADLTSGYLAYLDMMEAVNLDFAGEFLEIAATLIWIKSKHLLPKPPVEEEGEEEDPEERLRRQLIEYQRYKQAAFTLGCRDLLGRDVFIRGENENFNEVENEPPEQVFEEVSLYLLMDAFRRVMERPKIVTHVIAVEKYRIEDRIEDIIQMLHLKAKYQFEDFFPEKDYSRAMFIITFMALLEMVKLGLICVKQEQALDILYCRISDDFQENLTKWYEQQRPMKEINIA